MRGATVTNQNQCSAPGLGAMTLIVKQKQNRKGSSRLGKWKREKDRARIGTKRLLFRHTNTRVA